MGLAQQAVLHQREPGVHTYALDKGGATDSVFGQLVLLFTTFWQRHTSQATLWRRSVFFAQREISIKEITGG